MDNKKVIGNKLWAMADNLRGKINLSDLKESLLGLYFYKFVSERFELFLESEYSEDTEIRAKNTLGYHIQPKYQFKNMVFEAKGSGPLLSDLQEAFTAIENSASGKGKKVFKEIFSSFNFQSNHGLDDEERSILISKILLTLSEIDFHLENGFDMAIDGFEFLIDKFASSSGMRASDSYTPQNVSRILAKIVSMDKTSVRSVYDPACGTASLLLSTSKEADVTDFYGEELNEDIYRLALMNMIIHGVDFKNFDIQLGNSLEEPKHMDRKFEAIVSNPPFSAKWSASKKFLNDDRFKEYDMIPPRTKADYAFIQHMLNHLDKNGIMAAVMPNGVLYRGAIEGNIRKYMIEELNVLDGVIGLPENLYYSTSIPTVILIFKKSREANEDIFFIDASKCYEQIRHYKKNIRDEDVNIIIGTYNGRKDINKFAKAVSLEDIRSNDYNLSIPRYIDTFEERESVDREEIVNELRMIDDEINEADVGIKKLGKQLGINMPAFGGD
ncbi:MAG TPA: type I restriction-modification system subunit M [Methanobacterium sp.]|nr:MAG: type I restriction-modification system subunit M [Methanobacterium sp.]HOI71230.1 type I restriction-modification system subunit M [Methanobacterium sp.]